MKNTDRLVPNLQTLHQVKVDKTGMVQVTSERMVTGNEVVVNTGFAEEQVAAPTPLFAL